MNIRASAHSGSAVNVAELRLAHHVHACTTGEGMIFLDLRRGKYFGIGSASTPGLAGLLELWCGVNQDMACIERCSPAALHSISAKLLELGLLKPCIEGLLERQPVTAQVCPPLVSIDQVLGEPPRLLGKAVGRFISVSVGTAASLHCLPLETIVEKIRRRKTQRGNPAEPQNRLRMAELASMFRQIRSYAFSARNHCLLESLALIEFLARFGEFPTWCIGVKTAPFAAHSWVQYLDLVLNGTPEQVSFFTPIVTI